MPLQLCGEEPLAESDRLVLADPVHAGSAPRFLRCLDDERRVALLVLIRVHAPEPVFVPLEIEGEGGKRPRRAQPDEAVRAVVETRLELLLELLANGAADPVGRYEQIG